MYSERVLGSVCARNLFPEKPTIHFVPNVSKCCKPSLKIQKTRIKTAATLDIGEFFAKESILNCPVCGKVYQSRELLALVPPRCNFGYDVLVYVGKAAFLRYRSDKEIARELWQRNISISRSEIANLEKRFIVYLALVHQRNSPKIKEAIETRGGYILHLDGTCEGDSPHLLTGLDEITGFVLHNVKIPSEKADRIIPFLERIFENYGAPLAIVCDMGSGILCAVEEVFPGVPVFVCHFHFLRDIGNDLLGKENDIIRKRLRSYKITSKLQRYVKELMKIIAGTPDLLARFSAGVENKQMPDSSLEFIPAVTTCSLILWAFEGKKQGRGYGFPFDRPYVSFVQRLRSVYEQLEKIQDISLGGDWRDNKPFFRVVCDLKHFFSNRALKQAMTKMESKIEVFDTLRDAMRITIDEHHRGLNDNGEDCDIKTIEKGVENFRQWLLKDKRYSQDSAYQKMIEQIDKYWEKLFADPIPVDTPQGKRTVQPQRTNNILERFFRDMKRGGRRKSGTNSMRKKLKAMLANTPLVKNLENEEYLKIILKEKASLEELFAEIDGKIVREELRKAEEDREQIPKEMRDIIKISNLPQIVTQMFFRQVAS